MTSETEFGAALRGAVGSRHVIEGAIDARYLIDWSGLSGEAPLLLIRPRTTEEVARTMRLCHDARAPVVVQGGRTGVVGGALPRRGEIVLSLERMNGVGKIDLGTASVEVEAGATLQALQEEVEAQGYVFPLDLGSRGSCTIGGAVATNAGGNRVIRYGMMRELVLGLEVVLADGQIVAAARRLLKDNAGYDLKHLFIGSEGTLGVVTKAVLKLFPKPGEAALAFAAVASYDRALDLLVAMRKRLGARLTAFEVMWSDFYDEVLAATGARALLPPDQGLYILIEASGAADVSSLLEESLAETIDQGLLHEAIVSRSDADARRIWAVRDGVASAYQRLQPCQSYDIGLENSKIGAFADEANTAIRQRWTGARTLTFGHIGDGNVHLLAHTGSIEDKPALDDIVYTATQRHGGSISAEHGIGVAKAAYLHCSRSAVEIDVMRTLKRALDPRNILAPGRIFGAAGECT